MNERSSHGLKQAKRALRREILAARDALPLAERVAKSEAAVRRLLGLSEMIDASTVLAFWSFGSEIDTEPLLRRLLGDGKSVVLPRVERSELVPVTYTPNAPLTETTFGAMEPSSGRVLDPEELDLVVVPGLAFDRSGGRVGYGAGFYDRLLGRTGSIPAIALAFDLQVVHRVPRGRPDRLVDSIVTEHEVIRCR